MSKETIEKIRAGLAVDREETFRCKLAALMAEMESAKKADEAFLNDFAAL